MGPKLKYSSKAKWETSPHGLSPSSFQAVWSHDTQLGCHRAVWSMGSQIPKGIGRQSLWVHLGLWCTGSQVSWTSWGLLKAEGFGLLVAFLTFHRILISSLSSALDPAAVDYHILNQFSFLSGYQVRKSSFFNLFMQNRHQNNISEIFRIVCAMLSCPPSRCHGC